MSQIMMRLRVSRPMESLPVKEKHLFRSMMGFFDNKLYKKGLKAADTILKKYPAHGETLSMKGLILYHLKETEDQSFAIELAKSGLQQNVNSYLCWYILGLLHKLERKYSEAKKYFLQASRLDCENIINLNDLSSLQIHERDFKAFRETRSKLLNLQSRSLREWAALALANHLCGDMDKAIEILNEMETQFNSSREMSPFVMSELALYKVSIMEEAKYYNSCYDYQKHYSSLFLDKVGYLETFGRISLILNKWEDARQAYEYVQLYTRVDILLWVIL